MATKKTPVSKPAKKGAKARKPSPSKPVLPPKIYAQVSPCSVGGVSMFEAQHQINAATVFNFFSEGEVVNEAVARLGEAGFEILQITPMTINIAGPAEVYRKAFNTDITAEERPVIKEVARKDTATFIDCPETKLSGFIDPKGTQFEQVIEGVAIEVPRYFMAPSMFAPLKKYWHLRLPGDVSLADNADRAHRAGITGKGVKVAMVDTGWFKHPYFVGRGYNVAPVLLGPATVDPLKDEVGHGTGESANIFALAPDISFLPVKMSFVNSIGAFNAAAGLKPDIITCSWGSSIPFGPLSAADQALAAAIAAAVASGITVIFSAGNGHAGFPGQHPDVISAGGVFMNPDESLQASNYASGFMSNVYPGRRVPDLCGLVGMQPKAIYLMLPLEPNDQIDVGNAGGTHPNGDETANNDGWAAFSGTSAAAPQLAGAAALVKQACPTLKPTEIRDVLMKSARDVTTGTCNAVDSLHSGLPAAVGPDTATGNGLVDAQKAVLLAKVKCLGISPAPITIQPGPITPIQPGPGPIQPITPSPIKPITPIQPGPGPILPITPIQPGPITPVTPTPIKPITPITPTPIQPPKPIAPIVQPGPITQSPGAAAGMSEAGGPGATSGTLSAADVQSLEDLIVNNDINTLDI